MVDIVTENDEVITQTSKQEAHKLGLLHRCVIAELIDSQGNWILVQQAADRQDAGQFVSPVGGHVSAGEQIEAALAREALEETGITNFTHKFVGKAILNRNVIGRKENHYFLLYEIYSDAEPQLNHESVTYKKFSPAQLKTELRDHPELFGEAFHFVVQRFYPELQPSHLPENLVQ